MGANYCKSRVRPGRLGDKDRAWKKHESKTTEELAAVLVSQFITRSLD
jgi:hypothetical protein